VALLELQLPKLQARSTRAKAENAPSYKVESLSY